MTFAFQIKWLRLKRGWSQYELADRVGVRQPTISRFEADGGEEPSGPARKLLELLIADAEREFGSVVAGETPNGVRGDAGGPDSQAGRAAA